MIQEIRKSDCLSERLIDHSRIRIRIRASQFRKQELGPIFCGVKAMVLREVLEHKPGLQKAPSGPKTARNQPYKF